MLRSDGAGQEHYPDGTLKQVWTKRDPAGGRTAVAGAKPDPD